MKDIRARAVQYFNSTLRANEMKTRRGETGRGAALAALALAPFCFLAAGAQ
jgi:hypothetical protein